MNHSKSRVRFSGFDPENYKSQSQSGSKVLTQTARGTTNADRAQVSRGQTNRTQSTSDCGDDGQGHGGQVGGKPGVNPGGGVVSNFNIEIRFPAGGFTDSQRAAFQTAAARWQQIIVGDVQSAEIPSGEVVDDLVIDAFSNPIDGSSGILAGAAPTVIRPNGIPAAGFMEFDTADMFQMETNGFLVDVMIHEMGHVLGIGTQWSSFGFTDGNCPFVADPRYLGINAAREFATLINAANPVAVPVANTGGGGTRCGHWRESVFGNEMMTGFTGPAPNPISRMTIGTLDDMGYEVNYDAADFYVIPSQLQLMVMGVGDDSGNQRCRGCGCSNLTRRANPVVLTEEDMR